MEGVGGVDGGGWSEASARVHGGGRRGRRPAGGLRPRPGYMEGVGGVDGRRVV